MRATLKTILMLFLTTVLVVPCACAKSENERFAATPQEEYLRVASLAGDNCVFDIDAMTSFEAEYKGSFIADCIQSEDGQGIANISAIYQYSHIGDTYKSYAGQNTIWNFGYYEDDNIGDNYVKPAYTPSDPRGYQSDGYHWGLNQAVDTRSYQEILNLGNSPDTVYRRILTLPNAALLENFDGGKSSGTYTVMATVKDDCWDEFEQWMQSFYYYLSLFSLADGKQIANFFDFSQPHSAKLTVRSTRNMLTDVVLELTTVGKYDMGAMKFEARTTFKSGGVTVRDIER